MEEDGNGRNAAVRVQRSGYGVRDGSRNLEGRRVLYRDINSAKVFSSADRYRHRFIHTSHFGIERTSSRLKRRSRPTRTNGWCRSDVVIAGWNPEHAIFSPVVCSLGGSGNGRLKQRKP